MVKLILLRHGEDSKQSLRIFGIKIKERNLTCKGKEQVRKLVERLKNEKIDKIISSDVERSLQTSSIISPIIKKDFTINKRIRGRIPNNESNEEFIKRRSSFLEDMKKEKGTILVSAHGGTDKTILAITTENRKKEAELFNSIKQTYSCLNIIEIEKEKWKIRKINNLNHLL